MEENNGKVATQSQQTFKCTGDCLNCSPVQRHYCAAQHSYYSLRMLQSMQAALDAMNGTIEELKNKVSAIQDNEAMVFNPNTAQEGYGAEE